VAIERIVILGTGAAGHSCAFALRTLGYTGAIDLIGAESVRPYDRTLLSKDMLSRDGGEFPLSSAEAYADAEVNLRLGAEGVRLSPAERQLLLADGTVVRYDRLIICTGGKAVLPRSMDVPGVLTLRELRDVGAVRAALGASRRLVVVGGGFIGGEVASAAVAHCAVTIVEAASAPLATVLGTEVGARIGEMHRAAGVQVVTGKVCGITRDSGGHVVALQDGRTLKADAVVVGVGMRPATGWLDGSPVELGDGIITDARCRTALPGVLAAGDCARWPNPRYGGRTMRIEHWDTARRHGAAAAANALDEAVPFDPLPFFWSDQHGVKLQWVGHAPEWDAVEIDDESPACFSARYSRRGRLAGVLTVGRPRASAAARKELMAMAPEEC
jgi:NADPH-dependent 2,4-dienoyl-CoA reductase/sulfur reductase-like enzyme